MRSSKLGVPVVAVEAIVFHQPNAIDLHSPALGQADKKQTKSKYPLDRLLLSIYHFNHPLTQITQCLAKRIILSPNEQRHLAWHLPP